MAIFSRASAGGRTSASGARAAGTAPVRFAALDRLAHRLVARLLTTLGEAPIAVRLWDGTEVAPGRPARVRVHLREPSALWRLLFDVEFQLPECYSSGAVEIEGDLVEFFEILHRCGSNTPSLRARLAYSVSELLPRRHARERADVRSHYDLPADFYRLWLDESMTYTCAYFPEPSTALEAAQHAKLDLVCRKLGLSAGQRVVETGSGWGSLALHMAAHYGAVVTAYNVSDEQVAYARRRARELGLADRVSFVADDYRTVVGRFDAFVAVGMLEHLRRRDYRELGRTIARCLEPQGKALVHTIGRHRVLPPPRWTRKRVFPGAYMPALSEISQVFEPNGLVVLDVENLRLHYAKTLEHWLARFDRNIESIRELFDERSVRAWRLYLASAQAGFRTGWLQLFQIVATRHDNNIIPWTRRGPGSEP